MDFAKQQEQIENQALAHRVMLQLVRYQVVSSAGTVEDGYVWTDRDIAARMHYDDVEAIHRALTWLWRNGYIERRCAEWVKIRDSETMFREEIRDIKIRTSPQDFKTEALTGMDKKGNRSSLTRAALHGKEIRSYTDDDMVARCAYIDELRSVARMLGLSVEEAEKKKNSGEIGVCNGYGNITPHWGRFGPKGGRKQHLCNGCMAAMMRARRADK